MKSFPFFLYFLFILLCGGIQKTMAQVVSPDASIAADADQNILPIKQKFTKVVVQNCNCNVLLSVSDSNYAIIDATPSDMKQIALRSRGKTLIVKLKNPRKVERSQNININLYSSSYKTIVLNDHSKVSTQDVLRDAKIYVASYDDGDLRLKVEAEKVKARLKGKGNITLEGTTTKLIAKHQGFGHLNARGLQANKTNACVKSRGQCSVNTQRLFAYVKTNGMLYFVGHPRIFALVQQGGGLIRQETELEH